LQYGPDLTVLNLQRLTTAGTENSSVAATKCCNINLKITNVKMNITKKSSWPLDEASGKHISSITKIIVHLRYLGYIA